MDMSNLENKKVFWRNEEVLIFLAFILCYRCTAEADEMPRSSGTSITL